MTHAGWDPFLDAERQAAMGRTTMLIAPDGVAWLLVPGRPWQWARQGTPWQFGQPPADPAYRAACRPVPPPPPMSGPPSGPTPLPTAHSAPPPLPPQAGAAQSSQADGAQSLSAGVVTPPPLPPQPASPPPLPPQPAGPPPLPSQAGAAQPSQVDGSPSAAGAATASPAPSSGPVVEQLATGSRFVCGAEPVSEFIAKVVRIVGWADRTRHPGEAPPQTPPPVAPPPPPPEPEPPAPVDDSGGLLGDMARHTASLTLDVLAAGSRALKWREQRKQQAEYEQAHRQWQQQYQAWEQQKAAYDHAYQEWERQQREAQRQFELKAREQRQPNPLIVLVGKPHTGQRRLFRGLIAALEAAEISFGGQQVTPAPDLMLDSGSELPADAVLRHFVTGCDRAFDPPAMLVDEADALFGEKPGGVAGYLGELAHDQESGRLVVFAGTEDFLDQIRTQAPELLPRLLTYRLPDLAQPPAISALLDILAAERSMVLAPEARERMAVLAYESGNADNAREIESVLASASQHALGRGAASDGTVHIELADIEQLAALTTQAHQGEKSIDELLAELDAMIGLDSVKQRVRQLANEMTVDAQRRQAGLPVAARSRHLVFTGNPGTAKTTVARLIAQIYRGLGVLPKGQVVEVTRSDLVGEYLGQTAPKTRAACERAMGGVLFLDEAYNLVSGPDDEFGKEAVTELLLQMENHRDDFVVFAAGYPKEMDEFLESNPGLRSRFGGKVEFPDYTNEELAAIFELMAKNQGYQLPEEFRAALPEAIRRIPRGRGFANGRSVRGLLEATIAKQATRLAQHAQTDPAELALLVPEDLPTSGEAGVGQTDDAGPRRSLDELLAELDSLIGLAPVKQRVRTLIAETRLDARRRQAGLPVAPKSRHLVFTGNPGSAKTTVARLMGQLYRELGVLSSGHLVEVGRSDLVGEYLGETAPKTREVCQRAVGGVLFIDEAYNLVQEYSTGGDAYGQEAITELLVQMENHRDDLIVIAAGYPEEMDRFLDANEGLRSRFGGTVEFPDYTNEELAAIFTSMATKQGYRLAPDLEAALVDVMAGIDRGKGFANGRSARGLLEQAISAQAMRLAGPDADVSKLSDEELTLLTLADIPRQLP